MEFQVFACNMATGKSQLVKTHGAAAAALLAKSASEDPQWDTVTVHNKKGTLLVQFC